MLRRSVVAAAGSTVMSTAVMALARVSPAVRSLTGSAKVAKPSARDPSRSLGEAGPPIPRVARCWSRRVHVRGHPTRRRRRRSLPLGERRVRQVRRTANAARSVAGWPDPPTAVTPCESRCSDDGAAHGGESRAVWRASSRSACHRRRDPAAGQLIGSWRPEAASANASQSPTPSMREWEITKLSPGAAVGERQHREVPSGSVLGIQWGVGLLASQASNSSRGRGVAAISSSD